MRLVASDIDGTILGHDGKISDRTVRAFHACREAGVELVFVTGRPPRWLHPLQDRLGHTGTVICSNGAVVWDLEADRLVSARGLQLDAGFPAGVERADGPVTDFAVVAEDRSVNVTRYQPHTASLRGGTISMVPRPIDVP